MQVRNLVARRAAVFVLGLLIAFSMPIDAAACSCVQSPPPHESLEQSDAVFSGTVLGADTTENQRGLRVTVEVDNVWKGNVAQRATVSTAVSGAACGYPFNVGTEYLIYADESEGSLSTHLCSRTGSLEHRQDDIDAFENGDESCGMPVGAVSVQIFMFLTIGLVIGRWPVYL